MELRRDLLTSCDLAHGQASARSLDLTMHAAHSTFRYGDSMAQCSDSPGTAISSICSPRISPCSQSTLTRHSSAMTRSAARNASSPIARHAGRSRCAISPGRCVYAELTTPGPMKTTVHTLCRRTAKIQPSTQATPCAWNQVEATLPETRDSSPKGASMGRLKRTTLRRKENQRRGKISRRDHRRCLLFALCQRSGPRRT